MLSDGRVLYVPGVGQWDGQAWAYELPDGLGSTRQLANAQGYLVQRYDYGPFGEALASEGKRTNSLRYTGEQWDSDVGLLYLRARWYDPSAGRFTTRDPFLGLAGLPQTQHPYAYAGNNPINLTDPSGKFVFVPLLIAAGGGAIIGGAASGILYAISHPCDDLLNSPSFWRAVGAGAVGGFVAGLLPIGGSLGAAIVWGMVGGASSATASQLFVNLTTPGANWDNDLVGAAITGGIAGGVFGGVGYGVRQWLTLSLLERRAQQIHSALDPIAQARRTTAVLQTDAGRIVAGGVRDLTPAQRALLGPGEIPARLPGAHAEVTALQKANQLGATPVAMATTRAICPECAAVIEASGGTLTSPTTAIWFRLK